MKQCNDICKRVLPLTMFTKDKQQTDGLDRKCKECKALRHAQKKEVRKITRKASYEANKAHELSKCKEYRDNNPEKIAAYRVEYAAKHPGKLAAKTAKYRATKKQATPPWLTKEQLKEIETIYIMCPKGHDVDHIVPLQGKEVRGLHVPWNLQYLPLEINRYEKRAKLDYVPTSARPRISFG